MDSDEKFMRAALNEAREALYRGEVPIGAVVVAGGTIIGRGHNLVETLTDPTAHAEMQAITAACAALGGKYLTDCTLYVTIEPCPMCAAALGWAQLGRLVYGADDPKKGYSRVSQKLVSDSDPSCEATRQPDAAPSRGLKQVPPPAGAGLLHPRTTVTKGVLAEECGRLVTDFFQNRRK